MPILDEADYLADAVARVFAQEYAGDVQVVLALGPSKDGTDEIAARLAADEPRLTLGDQPDRGDAVRAERRHRRGLGMTSSSGWTGTDCSRPGTSGGRWNCWTRRGRTTSAG